MFRQFPRGRCEHSRRQSVSNYVDVCQNLQKKTCMTYFCLIMFVWVFSPKICCSGYCLHEILPLQCCDCVSVLMHFVLPQCKSNLYMIRLLWTPLVMGMPLCFRAYSCGLWFLLLLLLHLLLLFPRLFSAVGDWMSTILPHMMWP